MKVQNELPASATSSASVQSTDSSQLQRLNRFRSLTGAGSDTRDQVELSGLTSGIMKASDSLATEHAKRVEDLAKAYQNGRYTVQPRELSQKLVSAWISKNED